MLRLLPVLALTLAVACARGEPAGFDTVGSGYSVGGGQWKTGGGLTVAVRAFERGGRTLVCGAWATDRQAVMTERYNRDVMEVGSIYLDGERLVQNLAFMPRVRRPDDLAGSEARCVTSPVSWRPGFAEAAPRVRFPRYAVSGDDDEDSGATSGPLVFREAARPDVLP